MGALATVLLTILSVAAAYGLQEGSDAIYRKKVQKGNLTPDKIISLINSKLSKIQSLSAEAYNDAMDKLNAIPAIMESGNLKDYLSKVRSEASEKLKTARKRYSDVEVAVSDLKGRTANFANQTDSYKTSKAGKEEYAALQKDADNLIQNFSQEVNKIEKTV